MNNENEGKKEMKEQEGKGRELIKQLSTQLSGGGVYLTAFVKWTILASIMGGVCGLIGAAFHRAIEFVSELNHANPWLLYLLPVFGVILVFAYRACGQINDRGTNQVLDSVTTPEKVTPQLAPLIFLASVLTHLGGGSAGREGAALQIGASVAATAGKLLKLDEKDIKTLTLCGMSAVFSSLFGTPLAAAVFSLEVVSVGIMYYSALYPCILASITAFAVTGKMGIAIGDHLMTYTNEFMYSTLFQVLVVAVLSGLVSILFCIVTGHVHKWFHTYIKNDYLRIIVGGLAVIALTLLYGTRLYNGVGMDTIIAFLGGEPVRPEMFLLKLLLTAVTLGCGFRGGEIVPCMFVGASFGSFVSGLIGLDPGLGAAIGLISLFCGCVNCPVASMILAMELFGGTEMLYFGLACAVSYELSGYFGVYTSQHFNYSKVNVEFLKERPHARH